MLQEATNPAVVEQLARDTGLTQWGAGRQSLGFISRCRSHAAWHRPRVSRHAFLEIVPAGDAVARVRCAPERRARGVDRASARLELRALLAAIGRHQPGPHALVGDFNTLAPGELLDAASCRRGCARWCG